MEKIHNDIYNSIGEGFGDGEIINCLQCNKEDNFEIMRMIEDGVEISVILKPVRYDDPCIVIILVARDYHEPYHDLPENVIIAYHRAYKRVVNFMNLSKTKIFLSRLEDPILNEQSNYYVGQNKGYKKGIDHVHGHVHIEFRTNSHQDLYTFTRHKNMRVISDNDVDEIFKYFNRNIREF